MKTIRLWAMCLVRLAAMCLVRLAAIIALLTMLGCQSAAPETDQAKPSEQDSSLLVDSDWLLSQGQQRLGLSLDLAKNWQQMMVPFLDQPAEWHHIELILRGQELQAALLEASPWLFGNAPLDGRRDYASRILYWPDNQQFLDNSPSHPFGGLLGDLTVPLTSDSLIYEHQIYGLSNLTLGVTPLLGMLEGHGQPARTWQAFVQDPLHPRIAERRRQYLMLGTELLIQEIELTLASWQQRPDWGPEQWQQWQLNWTHEVARYWHSLEASQPKPEVIEVLPLLLQRLEQQ